ncbi:hypothetical protein [Sphingomonas sp. ID0503]|uniref:hypothetical protein n=1 Tax=Sphingomonas sp. ID0503 TaxID=3399691 RepID=UPI003AFACE91
MNSHRESGRGGRLSFSLAREGADSRVDQVLREVLSPPEHRLSDAERATMSAMITGLVREIATVLHHVLGLPAVDEEQLVRVHALLERASFMSDRGLASALLLRADGLRFATMPPAEWAKRLPPALRSIEPRDIAAFHTCLIRRADHGGSARLLAADLDADVRQRLVWSVASAVELAADDVADAHLARAVTVACAAFERAGSIDAAAVRIGTAVARQEHFETALCDLVVRGDVEIAAAVLSVKLDLPYRTVLADILDRDGQALATLLRAAGLPREAAAQMLFTVSEATALQALAAFDLSDERHAMRTVAHRRRTISDGGSRAAMLGEA